MERTSAIIAAAEDAADMRRRMGAAALEMDAASDGSAETQWRATVAARLPSQSWPRRRMLITAVDAQYRRAGRVRPPQRGRPGGRRRRQLCQWLRLQHRRTADTSTAATDPTPTTPIWQPDTHGCWCCHRSAADHGLRWTGACISQRRSTNYAHAAAESKRSSRTTLRAPCSATMRWIRRRVRPPPEPDTTKAEPSPEQLAEFWR